MLRSLRSFTLDPRALPLQVDNVAHWGAILQMAVLELIRRVCRAAPGEKGKYIKIILALLQSTSTAVVYECAVTLVSLSNAPTAVAAAANCYCQMLVSQSDNNVKLIVLDRLQVRARGVRFGVSGSGPPFADARCSSASPTTTSSLSCWTGCR